jgi:CheY-like chemotaxis protein
MAKILIVDDDAMVRRTIGRILRNHGHELIFAEDGQHGLEMFLSEQPAVIITDMIMPRMGGMEMISAIRSQRPDAKIIAMSGGARSDNLDFSIIAAKQGIDETIDKPFEPAALLDSIARCLGTAPASPAAPPAAAAAKP